LAVDSSDFYPVASFSFWGVMPTTIRKALGRGEKLMEKIITGGKQ